MEKNSSSTYFFQFSSQIKPRLHTTNGKRDSLYVNKNQLILYITHTLQFNASLSINSSSGIIL